MKADKITNEVLEDGHYTFPNSKQGLYYSINGMQRAIIETFPMCFAVLFIPPGWIMECD